MKRFRAVLASVFLAVLVSLGMCQPALAATYDDIGATNDALADVVEIFVNDAGLALDSEDVAAFQAAAAEFQQALVGIEDDFARLVDGTNNAEVKGYITQFADATAAMSSSAGQMSDSVDITDDDEVFNAAADSFNLALDDYSDASDAYFDYIIAHPEQSGDKELMLYLVLFAVAGGLLVLTILFTVLMPKVRIDPEGSLKKVSVQLIIAALIATIGSGVTFFWYRNAITSQADEYYVVYGPIIAGYVMLGAGIIKYMSTYVNLRKEHQQGQAAAVYNQATPQVVSEAEKPAVEVY